MNKTAKVFISPNTRTNERIEAKIRILESDTDPKSYFDPDELEELTTLGKDDYLAMLRKIQLSMQDSGSEE